MKIIGILTETSKKDVYVLEGNSNRYLIKQDLPNNTLNRLVIAYGYINVKTDTTGKVIKFFNPRLILSFPKGEVLWRAQKPPAEDANSEDFFDANSENFF